MMSLKRASFVVCCLLILNLAKGEDKDDEENGNRIYKFIFGGEQVGAVVDNCPTEPVTCETRNASTVYVRWGRSNCNTDTADMVYSGYIGGGYYTHTGAGTNPLCLPETPEYDEGLTSAAPASKSMVYGSEYETSGYSPMADVHNQDPVCAVCLARGRSSILMIPAKLTCPSGWTKEYGGLLMGGLHSHAAPKENICFDRNAEGRDGSYANSEGSLYYPAVGNCGSLPCPPYVASDVLSCVVCSR